MSKKKQENQSPRYRIVFDELVNLKTGKSSFEEEDLVEEFGKEHGNMETVFELFNSAPSIYMKKKRGSATHVVHTNRGYDVYFHVI